MMAQDLACIGVAEASESLGISRDQRHGIPAENRPGIGVAEAQAGFSEARGSSSWENTNTIPD
eukprot:8056446-Prorocentrum_lima.AAC.1